MRYRYLLLRKNIDIILEMQNPGQNFKKQFLWPVKALWWTYTKYDNAIDLMNESWNQIWRADIIKCWLKRKCFSSVYEYYMIQVN